MLFLFILSCCCCFGCGGAQVNILLAAHPTHFGIVHDRIRLAQSQTSPLYQRIRATSYDASQRDRLIWVPWKSVVNLEVLQLPEQMETPNFLGIPSSSRVLCLEFKVDSDMQVSKFFLQVDRISAREFIAYAREHAQLKHISGQRKVASLRTMVTSAEVQPQADGASSQQKEPESVTFSLLWRHSPSSSPLSTVTFSKGSIDKVTQTFLGTSDNADHVIAQLILDICEYLGLKKPANQRQLVPDDPAAHATPCRSRAKALQDLVLLVLQLDQPHERLFQERVVDEVFAVVSSLLLALRGKGQPGERCWELLCALAGCFRPTSQLACDYLHNAIQPDTRTSAVDAIAAGLGGGLDDKVLYTMLTLQSAQPAERPCCRRNRPPSTAEHDALLHFLSRFSVKKGGRTRLKFPRHQLAKVGGEDAVVIVPSQWPRRKFMLASRFRLQQEEYQFITNPAPNDFCIPTPVPVRVHFVTGEFKTFEVSVATTLSQLKHSVVDHFGFPQWTGDLFGMFYSQDLVERERETATPRTRSRRRFTPSIVGRLAPQLPGMQDGPNDVEEVEQRGIAPIQFPLSEGMLVADFLHFLEAGDTVKRGEASFTGERQHRLLFRLGLATTEQVQTLLLRKTYSGERAHLLAKRLVLEQVLFEVRVGHVPMTHDVAVALVANRAQAVVGDFDPARDMKRCYPDLILRFAPGLFHRDPFFPTAVISAHQALRFQSTQRSCDDAVLDLIMDTWDGIGAVVFNCIVAKSVDAMATGSKGALVITTTQLALLDMASQRPQVSSFAQYRQYLSVRPPAARHSTNSAAEMNNVTSRYAFITHLVPQVPVTTLSLTSGDLFVDPRHTAGRPRITVEHRPSL